jgi:DNA-binding transcriptional LysR family regulator
VFELYDLRNNFSYYYDFYISAKEKSFSEAGRIHNISFSSLSRSVSKLEEILDLKLVKATNKGFELTLDGNRLYKKLDEFFNSIDHFTANDLSNNLDVVLTIGTTRNIADFILAEYLTKFSKIYPNVKINIKTDSATNLNDFLLNHKIDILIDYLPHINYNEKYDLEVMPLTEYNTCFACSKSFYEKIKDKIHNLKDLSNYTLVISGSSRRRQILDEILQKNNINLSPKHLMPDSKLMADYIKANDFIGYFIEDELKEYDLIKIELEEEMPTNPIGIIYPKKTINHTARDFVKIVTED